MAEEVLAQAPDAAAPAEGVTLEGAGAVSPEATLMAGSMARTMLGGASSRSGQGRASNGAAAAAALVPAGRAAGGTASIATAAAAAAAALCASLVLREAARFWSCRTRLSIALQLGNPTTSQSGAGLLGSSRQGTSVGTLHADSFSSCPFLGQYFIALWSTVMVTASSDPSCCTMGSVRVAGLPASLDLVAPALTTCMRPSTFFFASRCCFASIADVA